MRPARYRFSFPQPSTHLIHVELSFRTHSQRSRLWMPAWTPGSYLIREYARNIRTIAATGPDGPIAVEKIGKDEWQVVTQPGVDVLVRYTVYAHELSVRTAHHDGTHAYLHPAQVYLLSADHAGGHFELALELPPGWTCATLLPRQHRPTADLHGVIQLIADDLDMLLDSPIEVGIMARYRVPEPARDTDVVVWGEPIDEAILPKLARVVNTVERFWGHRPFEHYDFLLHHVVGATSGLEHKHGTVVGADPDALAADREPRAEAQQPSRPGDATLDFLELCAHELFHAWNGKRLRPNALGPFDYRKENYTRELWIVEGLTSYYDALLCLRSGEMPIDAYLERMSKAIARLEAVPGRLVHALADASFDAWIKLYRPQEDSANASVSYYLKGALVGFSLDCWLRKIDPEGAGLDAFMRALYDLGAGERGYTLAQAEQLLERIAGAPLPSEITALWRCPGELPFAQLSAIGLELRRKEAPPGAVHLGFTSDERRGSLWVQTVEAGTPVEAAGLAPGDELIAVRGADEQTARVRAPHLGRAFHHVRPGEPLCLLVSRRDRIVELGVGGLESKKGEPQLAKLAGPSEASKAGFQRWSEQPWDSR